MENAESGVMRKVLLTQMTVDEMKTAKRKAEATIRRVLSELQGSTGCHVDGLRLDITDPLGGEPSFCVEIELKVPR